MPVQQISVVPARKMASNGRSTPCSKDKTESNKDPGRSGSRSSKILKASSSGSVSRTTSAHPSSLDICRPVPLGRVEEGCNTAVMTVSSAALGSSQPALGSSQQGQTRKKKPNRNRDSCSAPDGPATAQDAPVQHSDNRSDRSSDRSGERRERRGERRRERRGERHRRAAPPESDSSSDGEAGREARSWSREKAKRGRRRSGREGGGGGGEGMILQSGGSDEGKENQEKEVDNGSGVKNRRSGGGGEGREEGRRSSQRREGAGSTFRSPGGRSSLAEEGECGGQTTKSYQETGTGDGDMSAPSPQRYGGCNAPEGCSDDELEVCRICHCEGDEECMLITPCHCTGSMRFVHQGCLNQWIKSSDTHCCELCQYHFIMEAHLKPLRKWEKLQMSTNERRKIICSVMLHLVAIGCVLWSVYVLVNRTLHEINLGRNNDDLWRISVMKYYTAEGVLEWPFWTKLVIVAISVSGGLVFMYIQCKVYWSLWRRLKAFNRIITVQNCPEKPPPTNAALANGNHPEAVEVPVGPAPEVIQTDSDPTEENPV